MALLYCHNDRYIVSDCNKSYYQVDLEKSSGLKNNPVSPGVRDLTELRGKVRQTNRFLANIHSLVKTAHSL